MADFHAADLWVAVIPETSQVGPAMEKAGQEAKTSFGRAVKDFGKTIHDDLDKIGDKAKDSFGKAGRTAGKVFSTEIGSTIRSEIGGAFSDIGNAFRSGNITGAIDGINNKMSGIENLAKTVGIDIAGWKIPTDTKAGIDEFDKKASDVLKNVTETSGLFADLPGKIGAAASKMAVLGGEVGLVVAGLQQAAPYIERIDKAIHDSGGFGKWIQEHTPGDLSKDLADALGADKSRKFFGNLFGYDPDLGHGTSGPGWASSPSVPGNLLNPFTRPYQDLAPGGIGSGIGAPSAPSSSSGWDKVAQAESGGNWHINTGNGYFGGLQFDQNTWNDFGGQDFAPRPDLATPDQQKAVADRVPVSQRAGRWPNTYKNFGSGGGTPPAAGGLPNVRGAHPQLAYALAAAKQMFPDLQLTAGRDDHPMDQGWHPRGQAIDIGGGTPQEQAQLSNWLLQFAPSIEELIHSGPGVTQNIKSGRIGPAIDMPGSVYNSGQAGYHGDHVHLAIKDEMAQVFEAALGGGGLMPPGLDGRGPGGKVPTGAEHDPLYVTAASSGSGGSSGGGSPFESQGSQLGQGLVNGVLQMFGIDGSVFGGKSPLDWGAVKLGGGLLNWGMKSLASGPMGSPAMSGGGGGGMLAGLGGLVPHPGPMVSAAAGPGGSFGMKDAVGGPTTIHHDNRTIVTGNNIKDNADLVMRQQWEQNSRFHSIRSGLPQTGPGSP